jgi:DNA-binding FadR family transcriptional regulator
MEASPGGRIPAKYRQISTELRERILSGRLKPGDKLEGQAILMERYSVSMATVVRALDDLRKDGLIKTEPGIGTTVLEMQPHADIPAEIEGLRGEAAYLRKRLGAVEAALIDLYAKSGYQYPGHAPADGGQRAARS